MVKLPSFYCCQDLSYNYLGKRSWHSRFYLCTHQARAGLFLAIDFQEFIFQTSSKQWGFPFVSKGYLFHSPTDFLHAELYINQQMATGIFKGFCKRKGFQGWFLLCQDDDLSSSSWGLEQTPALSIPANGLAVFSRMKTIQPRVHTALAVMYTLGKSFLTFIIPTGSPAKSSAAPRAG